MCPHWGRFNYHAVRAPWFPSSGSGSNSHTVLQIKEKKPKRGGLDGTYPGESGFQLVVILSTHHQSNGGHPGSLLTPTPPQLQSPISSLAPGYRACPHPRWVSTVHVGLARRDWQRALAPDCCHRKVTFRRELALWKAAWDNRLHCP